MCGRFASGNDANELEQLLGSQLRRQQRDPTEDAAAADDDEANVGDDSLRPDDQQEGSRDSAGPVASGSASSGTGTGRGSQASVGVHWDAVSKQAYRARYNVAPQSRAAVVTNPQASTSTAAAKIELMRWGLIPSWTKRVPEKPLNTINCRADTLFSGSGMWSGIRNTKRCIVVAQGFYEWLIKGRDKIPYFTKLPDGHLMVFAGLWDSVTYQNTTEEIKTFTIVTTDNNKQLSFLHDRMPAILASPNEIALWLSSEPWSPAMQALIRPYEGPLECYKVPQEVGKVQNDSPDFIKPVAERKGNIASMFAAQASSPPKPKAETSKVKAESSSAKAAIIVPPAIKKRDRSSSVEIVEPPEKKPAFRGTAAKVSEGLRMNVEGPKKSKRNSSFTRKGAVQTDKKGNGLVTSFFRKEAD